MCTQTDQQQQIKTDLDTLKERIHTLEVRAQNHKTASCKFLEQLWRKLRVPSSEH